MFDEVLSFECNNCGESLANSSMLIKEQHLFNDCFIFEGIKLGNKIDELYEPNFESLSQCTFLEIKCLCETTIGGYCINAPRDKPFLKKTIVLDSQNVKRIRIDQNAHDINNEVLREINEMKNEFNKVNGEIRVMKEELANLKSMIYDLNNSVLANSTEIIRISQILTKKSF